MSLQALESAPGDNAEQGKVDNRGRVMRKGRSKIEVYQEKGVGYLSLLPRNCGGGKRMKGGRC